MFGFVGIVAVVGGQLFPPAAAIFRDHHDSFKRSNSDCRFQSMYPDSWNGTFLEVWNVSNRLLTFCPTECLSNDVKPLLVSMFWVNLSSDEVTVSVNVTASTSSCSKPCFASIVLETPWAEETTTTRLYNEILLV